MSLTIDHREKDLKTLFPDAEYKNMDLGDIHIKFKNSDHTFLLIERKTMSDLIASINDGRYREQKKRLLESGIPRERILYLLEGRVDDIPGHMKTLFGMIINTIYRDKILVLRLDNLEETAFFIKRVMKKLLEEDPHLMPKESIQQDGGSDSTNDTNLEYLSTIKLKKKDNMTPNNCSILQLAQIPGMSIQNAQIIINKYNSMANLINEYYQIQEENRSNMLSDLEIPISNGKKRKLGKVLSERVYKYLFNFN
jgi:crossover junction endonuclease MUS81